MNYSHFHRIFPIVKFVMSSGIQFESFLMIPIDCFLIQYVINSSEVKQFNSRKLSLIQI